MITQQAWKEFKLHMWVFTALLKLRWYGTDKIAYQPFADGHPVRVAAEQYDYNLSNWLSCR